MLEHENQVIINDVKKILIDARSKIAVTINNELLIAYWNIGRIIVENEQLGLDKAEYGSQLLKNLSKELTKEFGRGFSRSNLQNMRLLYLNYPICQSLSGKLSYSHYCELFLITDISARSFYEQESINSNWSVGELKRQIETSLFERLILSNGDLNKQKVMRLSITV